MDRLGFGGGSLKALVTGAAGAVGSRLLPALEEAGWRVDATDLDSMDVTDSGEVWTWMNQTHPDVVFHLAGSKLAVDGELNPEGFARVNVTGTGNVVRAASAVGARMVFSSTCKAADPETAYGASKLIAERIVLNAGGVVARFYNIPECGPSVFTVWAALDPAEPVPYTDCWRHFTTVDDAVGLLLRCADLPSGRYALNPGSPRHMRWVAAQTYPDRLLMEIPRRRGDRAREPLMAACEIAQEEDGVWKIVGAHDPALVAA